MKKKIFITRKLLKENEDKLKNLFEVTLNKDDKIYTPQEIIDGSKNYDGILSSVTDPINADTISKLSDLFMQPLERSSNSFRWFLLFNFTFLRNFKSSLLS